MALTPTQIEDFAQRLDEAALATQTIIKLTDEAADLDMAAAYRIQRALVDRYLARGDRLIGMKMGLTSRAKMRQMGVHEPIYGHLTEAMILAHGGSLQRSEHGHPRAEPEVAFRLCQELSGPTTREQAQSAVGEVCAALEIIDSRYRDFRFTLADVVADNASSARFVLGPWQTASASLDLGDLGIVLEVDGEAIHQGSSAAILDHPLESLATLANMLAGRGESLAKGSVVLAGAATAAVHLEPGQQVSAVVEGLGSATVHVV